MQVMMLETLVGLVGVLVEFFGDDEEDFYLFLLAVSDSRPELPLVEGIQNKLRLEKPGRE